MKVVVILKGMGKGAFVEDRRDPKGWGGARNFICDLKEGRFEADGDSARCSFLHRI